jgi:hypothetical protein
LAAVPFFSSSGTAAALYGVITEERKQAGVSREIWLRPDRDKTRLRRHLLFIRLATLASLCARRSLSPAERRAPFSFLDWKIFMNA